MDCRPGFKQVGELVQLGAPSLFAFVVAAVAVAVACAVAVVVVVVAVVVVVVVVALLLLSSSSLIAVSNGDAVPACTSADVKIIQVDISGEEIGVNVPVAVGLVGDAKAISAQLADAVSKTGITYPSSTPWWTELREKVCTRQFVEGLAGPCVCSWLVAVIVVAHWFVAVDVIVVGRLAEACSRACGVTDGLTQAEVNRKYIADKMKDEAVPMGYYRAFKDIHAALPRDCIMVRLAPASTP